MKTTQMTLNYKNVFIETVLFVSAYFIQATYYCFIFTFYFHIEDISYCLSAMKRGPTTKKKMENKKKVSFIVRRTSANCMNIDKLLLLNVFTVLCFIYCMTSDR